MCSHARHQGSASRASRNETPAVGPPAPPPSHGSSTVGGPLSIPGPVAPRVPGHAARAGSRPGPAAQASAGRRCPSRFGRDGPTRMPRSDSEEAESAIRARASDSMTRTSEPSQPTPIQMRGPDPIGRALRVVDARSRVRCRRRGTFRRVPGDGTQIQVQGCAAAPPVETTAGRAEPIDSDAPGMARRRT
jgi:hypothetical protein